MLSSSLPPTGPNPLAGRESLREPPTIPEEGALPHRPQTKPAHGVGRLAVIAEGKTVPTETHAAVAKERSVLQVDDFNLWYGTKQALFGINMAIPEHQVTALVGPSGCGKSTLLRSVNRLNDLLNIVRIEGDMRLNGDSIYHTAVDVIELRKRMGMVFQKPNPVPHEHLRKRRLLAANRRRAQPRHAGRGLRAQPAAAPPCGTK